MDPKIKNWIDNASYEQLLARWRHAPVGSPYFQDETGDYYKKVMKERKAQVADTVQVSKNVGW